MSNLIHKNKKGFVLPVGLMFLVIISLLGAMAVVVTTTDIKIGGNYESSVQAFYAAEAGIEHGLNRMRQVFQSLNPNLEAISPPEIDGVTFEFEFKADGGPSTTDLDGIFAGLNAYVQNYKITSKAQMDRTNASSKLTLTVRDELIAIFQFGIFYQADVEILPGPSMTFTGGRIHSNSDIYLNTEGSTLSIDSNITSAGNIYHRRKDKDSTPGTVRIKDKDGEYKPMNIDSTDETWATASQTVWGGTVKSRDHGINEINVPTGTEAGTPIDILGTGNGSLCSKSGLHIINGEAKDKDGNTVDLTDAGTKADPISGCSFYDAREDKMIHVTQVDMDKLQSSQNAMDALRDPPNGGDQGILYVSSTDGTNKSVRLVNGSSLPEDGLTVASNNPVYIQGDYNNITESPAAVICDAVTILSNSWDDANADSSSSSLSNRIASNTTVNAAIMAGNKNTVEGKYSGGVENFPRFLEKWSGKTFTYSGSLICLWESQQATGNWGYGSPIYTAPTRVWSYGIDAGSLPSGTPRVRNISKLGWYQVIE